MSFESVENAIMDLSFHLDDVADLLNDKGKQIILNDCSKESIANRLTLGSLFTGLLASDMLSRKIKLGDLMTINQLEILKKQIFPHGIHKTLEMVSIITDTESLKTYRKGREMERCFLKMEVELNTYSFIK